MQSRVGWSPLPPPPPRPPPPAKEDALAAGGTTRGRGPGRRRWDATLFKETTHHAAATAAAAGGACAAQVRAMLRSLAPFHTNASLNLSSASSPLLVSVSRSVAGRSVGRPAGRSSRTYKHKTDRVARRRGRDRPPKQPSCKSGRPPARPSPQWGNERTLGWSVGRSFIGTLRQRAYCTSRAMQPPPARPSVRHSTYLEHHRKGDHEESGKTLRCPSA